MATRLRSALPTILRLLILERPRLVRKTVAEGSTDRIDAYENDRTLCFRGASGGPSRLKSVSQTHSRGVGRVTDRCAELFSFCACPGRKPFRLLLRLGLSEDLCSWLTVGCRREKPLVGLRMYNPRRRGQIYSHRELAQL